MEAIKRLAEKGLGGLARRCAINAAAGEQEIVLAVVAAGLLAVALIEAVPDFKPRQGVLLALAGPLGRPAALGHAPVPATPSPALRDAREAGPEALSLEEFVGLLEKSAPAPVAKSFAAAFLKERPLREAWQRSGREKGPKAPARDFLRRISGMPEFRRLMSQFRGEPGFQRAFLQLARNPEVSALLRGATGNSAAASLGAQRAAAPRPRSNVAIRQLAGGSSLRAVSSGLPSGGSPVSVRTAGAPSASVSLRDAVASGPGSTPMGASLPSAWDAAGRPWSAANGGRGDVNALRTLAPLSSAGASREAGSLLDGIFATAPKELRDALLYQCEVNDICDPVAACMAANMFDECVAACADNPACSGQGILPSPSAGAPAPAGGEAGGAGIGAGKPKILRGGDGNGQPLDAGAAISETPACPIDPATGGDDWALGGQLIGGVLGAVAGGILGSALGPAGTILGGSIGGALGAEVGGFVGDALGDLVGIVF